MALTGIRAACSKGISVFSFHIIRESLKDGHIIYYSIHSLYVNSLLHLQLHLLFGAIVGIVTEFRHTHIRQLRRETRNASR